MRAVRPNRRRNTDEKLWCCHRRRCRPRYEIKLRPTRLLYTPNYPDDCSRHSARLLVLHERSSTLVSSSSTHQPHNTTPHHRDNQHRNHRHCHRSVIHSGVYVCVFLWRNIMLTIHNFSNFLLCTKQLYYLYIIIIKFLKIVFFGLYFQNYFNIPIFPKKSFYRLVYVVLNNRVYYKAHLRLFCVVKKARHALIFKFCII